MCGLVWWKNLVILCNWFSVCVCVWIGLEIMVLMMVLVVDCVVCCGIFFVFIVVGLGFGLLLKCFINVCIVCNVLCVGWKFGVWFLV